MRCENCPLTDCVVVPGYGDDPADIVIVGEAPGNTEVKEGRPFVGPAGRLLDRLLEEAGLSGYRIYKTNSILCRPWPHRAPKPEEVKACNPRLMEEIRSKNPRIIIGMGAISLRALTGKNGITKHRGLVYEGEPPIICTYHPAAVLRGREDWYHDILQDLRMARDLLEGKKPDTSFDWEIVTARYQLPDLENEVVAVDVETDSQGRLLCVGVGHIDPETGRPEVYIIRWPADQTVVGWLDATLTNNTVVAHNIKFDAQVLWAHGIPCSIDEDTMLMHYALVNKVGRNGLKDMAATYLYVGDYDAEVAKHIGRLEELDFETVAHYNAQDVAYTLLLYRQMMGRLSQDRSAQRVYYNLLMPAANQLARMEYLGVQIDTEALERLDQQYQEEMADLYRQMVDLAGQEFNPNSHQQVQDILFNKLELPVVGKLGTDKATLRKVQEYTDNPFPELLLRYRQVDKLHSTYVTGLKKRLDVQGRVHGRFNLHTTVTGRLSSSDPNLQNIPKRDTKEIRNLFVATPGYKLIEADFSQAELRCLAWYSKDPNLMEIIRSGADLHRQTASLMYRVPEEEVTDLQRHIGKTLNFAVLYGAGPGKVVETIKEVTPEADVTYDDAVQAIRRWHDAFPKATEWIHEVQQYALKNRRTIETPFGRHRRFDLITPENKDEVLRQAVNTPIQSLASDLTLASLIRIGEAYEYSDSFRLLLTVHDSILAEALDEDDLPELMAERMRQIMLETVRDVLGDDVPFEVDIKTGYRWGSLEEVVVGV